MDSLLKIDALKTIWCEPIQDYQHTLKPARLTRAGGTTRYVLINNERVTLPNADNPLDKSLYHVYHIGRRLDDDFNFNITNQWVSLSVIAELRNVVFDLFFINGSKYPIAHAVIKRLNNNDIILAVLIKPIDLGLETFYDESIAGNNTRPVTMGTSDLYFRTYANARYDALDWRSDSTKLPQSIVSHTQLVKSHTDYVNFIAYANTIESTYTSGDSVYYCDGFVISKPLGFETSFIGKTFIFSFDQSIKRKDVFMLADLPTFLSQLDIGHTKYAAINPSPYNMIDFYDDIDVYMVNYYTGTAYRGIYVPRLQDVHVRQLTHSAYSFDKPWLDALIAKHELFDNHVKIMLVVREGGMKRGLTNQHERINDLYRLSSADQLVAMTDNTLVPEWLLPNLEASAYTEIMRSNIADITEEMVANAYGYNAAVKAILEPVTPIQLVAGQRYVLVPPGLTIPDAISYSGKRALFFYDQGLLKQWYLDTGLYPLLPILPTVAACDTVEAFDYEISTTTDGIIYNQNVSHLYLKQHGFRAYVCPMVGGVPNEEWEDVTDTNYYTYEPLALTPTLSWNWGLLAQADLYPCVKMNHIMFIKDVVWFGANYNGVMQIEMRSTNNWLGTIQETPQHVYPGTVDVFMDGSPLIENIDYYIQWPMITVVKRPLSIPALTRVTVRCYGLCNPVTMRNYAPREMGFVKGGILSINDHYDIRNDRSIRIIADGLFWQRNSVRFAESDTGALIPDGKPYAISDYILGVERFTPKTLIPYRNVSLDLDERVMDYLTPRLPNTIVRHPVVMTGRWNVVSPFCSAVLHALLDGFLNTGVLDGAYTKSQTDTWLAPYLDLLPVDPCVRGVDENYLCISPHQYGNYIEVTHSQYRFIEFININYLNGAIDPTLAIAIG